MTFTQAVAAHIKMFQRNPALVELAELTHAGSTAAAIMLRRMEKLPPPAPAEPVMYRFAVEGYERTTEYTEELNARDAMRAQSVAPGGFISTVWAYGPMAAAHTAFINGYVETPPKITHDLGMHTRTHFIRVTALEEGVATPAELANGITLTEREQYFD